VVQKVDLGHGGLDNAPRIIGPVTVATTARLGDYILADTSGGAFGVTLPAADTIGTVYVKLHGGTSVTISPAGTDTIDDAANLTLSTTGEIVALVSDGTSQWRKVDGAYALSSLGALYVRVPEGVQTTADAGAAFAVPEPSVSGLVDVTLTEDCTFTFPAASIGKTLKLLVRQDGVGGWAVTWPAGTVYPDGVTAVISEAASAADYVELVCLVEDVWTVVQHVRTALAVNTVAAAGAALTIPEPALYEYNDITLSAATCALTFPATSVGKTLKMVIRQDGAGARAVTWPVNSVFPGGTDVVITVTASAVDYVEAFCVSDAAWMITRIGAAYAT
jgi:hypothetical protein